MSTTKKYRQVRGNNKKRNLLFFGVLLCPVVLIVVYLVIPSKISTSQAVRSTAHETVHVTHKPRSFSAASYKLVQRKRCAGCHGTKGQGRLSVTAPPLSGQSAEMLVRKIKAYRSGKIDNPAMRLMTKDLTDEEIDLLAKYYSQFTAPEKEK